MIGKCASFRYQIILFQVRCLGSLGAICSNIKIGNIYCGNARVAHLVKRKSLIELVITKSIDMRDVMKQIHKHPSVGVQVILLQLKLLSRAITVKVSVEQLVSHCHMYSTLCEKSHEQPQCVPHIRINSIVFYGAS